VAQDVAIHRRVLLLVAQEHRPIARLDDERIALPQYHRVMAQNVRVAGNDDPAVVRRAERLFLLARVEGDRLALQQASGESKLGGA